MDENMKRVANMKTMADNFPFLGFKNNLFINNGSIGCFWECEPLSSIGKELGMFEDLVQHILPDGAFVQVSIMSGHRTHISHRLFVSFSLGQKIENCNGQEKKWAKGIETKLKEAGLKPRRCGPDDLLDFADFFFQTNKNAKKRKAVLNQIEKTISGQILSKDASVVCNDEIILVDEKKAIKSFVFEDVPNDCGVLFGDLFFDGCLGFPFVIQTTIMVESQNQSKRRIHSFCGGEICAKGNLAKEKKIVQYAISGAYAVFENDYSKEKAEREFLDFFQNNGFTLCQKKHAVMPTLVGIFPTAFGAFKNILCHRSLLQQTFCFKTTFVNEAVDFLPIVFGIQSATKKIKGDKK